MAFKFIIHVGGHKYFVLGSIHKGIFSINLFSLRGYYFPSKEHYFGPQR